MYKYGLICALFGFVAACDEISKDEEVGVEDTASAIDLDHEVCDGVDNDGDGEIDENASGTWYTDTDADTYGGSTVAIAGGKDTGSAGGLGDDGPGDGKDTDTAVEVDPPAGETGGEEAELSCPSGASDNSLDCDDDNAAVNPAAIEICNAVDDDCDGTVDAEAADAKTWYADVDDDGYGDATGSSYTACDPIVGGDRSNPEDCDDDNAAINPAATEICDNVDNDCDGEVDDNPVGLPTEVETCWDRAGYECYEVTRCLVVSGETEECLTEAQCEREIRDEGISTLETRW